MTGTATTWLNGDLIPAADARIDPADRGLLLADGLFETLLARHGMIINLDRHITRLTEGAAILGIPLPLSATGLRAAASETLAANGLHDADRASLRITLTRGPAGRGLALPATPQPTLIITATQAPPAPQGLSVMTSSVRKVRTSPASALKTLNYTDHVIARREADTAGADEALMLTEQGGIACATIGNVFVMSGKRLLTPPDDGAIRAGITRADVLTLAPDHGLTVDEAPLSIEALRSADDIFLTNSLWGICPVTELDGTRRQTTDATKKLAQALDDAWASLIC